MLGTDFRLIDEVVMKYMEDNLPPLWINFI